MKLTEKSRTATEIPGRKVHAQTEAPEAEINMLVAGGCGLASQLVQEL